MIMTFEAWQNLSQVIKIVGGIIVVYFLYKIEKNTKSKK